MHCLVNGSAPYLPCTDESRRARPFHRVRPRGASLTHVLPSYYRKEERTVSETTSQRAAERQARRSAQRRQTQPAAPLGDLAKLATRPAQVRLRPDELARLAHSMRVLQITSTSDALREGLRLLEREAYEEEAAAEIR